MYELKGMLNMIFFSYILNVYFVCNYINNFVLWFCFAHGVSQAVSCGLISL